MEWNEKRGVWSGLSKWSTRTKSKNVQRNVASVTSVRSRSRVLVVVAVGFGFFDLARGVASCRVAVGSCASSIFELYSRIGGVYLYQ